MENTNETFLLNLLRSMNFGGYADINKLVEIVKAAGVDINDVAEMLSDEIGGTEWLNVNYFISGTYRIYIENKLEKYGVVADFQEYFEIYADGVASGVEFVGNDEFKADHEKMLSEMDQEIGIF